MQTELTNRDAPWPEETARAAAQGEITLGDGNPPVGQEPIARLVIDLYSLDRQVTVKYLIPYGSELAAIGRRGSAQVEAWQRLVSTLKRNLDEIVEIHARRWWTADQARFTSGARVRLIDDPNFPTDATATIAPSPGPRRVGPGVLYRVLFDEPQVNRHNGRSYAEADVLEPHLEPLQE